MPRLRQVPRAEAEAPIVTRHVRPPVRRPRPGGRTGHLHRLAGRLVDGVRPGARRPRARRGQGFGLYQSPKRFLDPVLRELAQTRAGWAAGSQFVFSQHCKSLRGLEVGRGQDRRGAPLGGGRLLSTDRTAGPGLHRLPGLRPRPGARRAVRRPAGGAGDEEILELTYITALYLQHAVMSRALRTEFDDRQEPIVEAPETPA